MLTHLALSGFRNFKEIEIQPANRINLILGENGSGKTSLLEAIHLLGLGRSFRTRVLKNTVQFDANYSQVFARIKNQTPVGFQFDLSTGVHIRLNNAPLKKLSELATHLPLQFIPANCHAFFESGPRFRRKLVDWGVFHVEHEFLYHWQSYRKALLQRNATLKQHKKKQETQLWNESLVQHGEAISSMRLRYLKMIKPLFDNYFQQLCPALSSAEFTLRYLPGWLKDQSFAEVLTQTLERDQALGYTRSGAHAADWSLRIDDADPAEVLSRGQQKLFFIAISLAQVEMLLDKSQGESLLLIDDISSELDAFHQQKLIALIATLPIQSFLTSTQNTLENQINTDKLHRVFHVKHGRVLSVEAQTGR